MVAFIILSLISGFIIQQIPKGDSRGAIGLPLVICTFGALLYALHRGERHTWDVVQSCDEGVPLFYSFGMQNTMLLGQQKGWVGYGCLKQSGTDCFRIDAKHRLLIEHIGTGIEFGSVMIENRVQPVACITSRDGIQLFLWQPGRDIREALAPMLTSENRRQTVLAGIPKIEDWPVVGPTRLTTRGLWPTFAIVCLLQIGMVYLSKLAQMPGIELIPIGLTVAPMIYFLFEGAARQRTMLFGEFLERQVVAHDLERLA
ncbi:MAG: hypothetical protein WCK51_11550 [Armatimonadota bacterium]